MKDIKFMLVVMAVLFGLCKVKIENGTHTAHQSLYAQSLTRSWCNPEKLFAEIDLSVRNVAR